MKDRFLLFSFFTILAIKLLASCGSSPDTNPPEPPANGNNGSENVLRIFVYNIHDGEGMDGVVDIERIADVIREKDPHLVALNEVDIGTERVGGIDTMERLAESLDMEPVFGRNIDHQGGEYGNGILTNLSLISSKNMHLEMSEEREQRGLLQTEVEFEGSRIAFMTTHLDHQSDVNRQLAVQQIIEAKENYPGMPVLVAGDFNATPDDGVIGTMNVHFTDVWDEVGDGPGYTIPVPISSANRRIDYIFYSNSMVEEGDARLRPVHIEVINTTASDHLPVYAEFEVVP